TALQTHWRKQLRSDERYGMSSQVSLKYPLLSCPPKRITRCKKASYVIPAPSRAGGDCTVGRCVQLGRPRPHTHVLFWSTPPLPPPKRTTACRNGSKAAEPAYTHRGCISGDCRVHVVPS